MRSIKLLSILFILSTSLHAQSNSKLNWTLRLGYNIGATSPVSLPAEVRKINSYTPKFNPQIGVLVGYPLDNKWGLGTGLSLDLKGMRVKSRVKYMHTNVVTSDKGDHLEGYFVGKNTTNVTSSYITIPVFATYKFDEKWDIRLGIYAARKLSANFKGNVSDGYMRVETTTGVKQDIDLATFDFKDDIRNYDLGALIGANFNFKKKIGIYGDLSWAFLPFFKGNSNPINFNLYNIYGTIGVSYKL